MQISLKFIFKDTVDIKSAYFPEIAWCATKDKPLFESM